MASPNVLLICCDDLAYGDLACHGNPWVRTPRLDALFGESVRLTRYYSGPMCSPARACLMTGRYNYRTGVVDTSAGRAMMHPDEVTVAEVLSGAGYATGLFGKWHLGDAYPLRPMDQGFGEAVWHRAGTIVQAETLEENGYFDPLLLHGGRVQKYAGYCTDIFATEAMRFIGEHRARPFFAYLAFNCPHTPLQVDEAWAEPYRRMGLPETFARIYGMVENIDANVGRVLDHLAELGLADDTIVIFTSDHGPCPSARHEGRDRYNAGLRDRKGSVYDGGLRVPCFVRWPARLRGPAAVERIAHPIDMLPTLADASGVSPPPGVALDGVSLLPLLTGKIGAADWPDRHLFFQLDRMADVPRRYGNYAVVTQRHKLLPDRPGRSVRLSPDHGDELYDLLADPAEQHDLAAQQPELVASLRGAYDRWFDDVASSRGFEPPRIVLDTPDGSATVLSRQDWRGPGRVHMQDHELGTWMVEISAPGVFDVTLRIPRLAEAQALGVAFGGVQLAANMPAGATAHTFEAVDLPAARGEWHSWIEDAAGHRRGVWTVQITRHGAL